MAQILDGQAIALQVRAEVKDEVEALVREGHRPPYLAVVLVGDNAASASYVRGKHKAAAEVGMAGDTLPFDASISEAALLRVIDDLNTDDTVDGILVQLPLPPHIDEHKVIDALRPDKDVDGFHPENAGRLVIGRPAFAPATPAGILELLRRAGLEVRGRHAVIVGRSNIVGKPLANLLVQKGVDATVTVCHSRTRDLGAITRQADLLIAAMGQARFIRADMVRDGAVVVDVGMNRVDDPTRPRGYRLVGDVDFDAVAEKASWITPVPGGVGPMTIAMLLKNTLKAAKQFAGR
jgi:methylenetetrahydrofolate dehydrogenase (NADP+)/methenyltetrahydrofolate cyclohydrolase